MGIVIAILVLPSIEGSTATLDETKWEMQGWRKCCDIPGNGVSLKLFFFSLDRSQLPAPLCWHTQYLYAEMH